MKRAAFLILFLISALSLARFQGVYAADPWVIRTAPKWQDSMIGNSNNATKTTFGWGEDAFLNLGNETNNFPSIPGSSQKGAVNFISNVVAYTFTTPPADLGVWIADTGQTLGFIPKQAYAQGVGFSGLLPLLPIWKVFRNVAYLLMAAVMVVIGFMIMFRKKIDPKTVITAQNAIPRVIISLILITFSYAIVGFVIDLMYVAMALVAMLFQSTGLLSNVQANMTSAHMFSTFWVSLTSFNPLKLLLGNTKVTETLTPGWQFFGSGAIGVFLAVLFGTITGGGAVIGLLGAIEPLIYAIYGIALLFLWIKLLAFFVSAYIQIILALLIGPLQLLGESFPGSNAFSSWFKNLIANIAVFPVAAAMFMLSSIFLQFSNSLTETNLWVPPYVGLSTSSAAIGALVSIGLLFAVQPVCASIKEALKAKPLIGGFGGGGAGGSMLQNLSYAYYAKSLLPSKFLELLPGGKGHGGGGEE